VKFGEIVLSNFDIETSKLAVYPNPATDHWTIHSDNTIITQIDIYDLNGKLRYRSTPNDYETVLKCDHLNHGIYIGKI